jgi:uncharacterized protein (DUF2235 family)
MKRLVLCFDGTWNSLSNPKELTNIVKIANAVSLRDANGIDQVCYYNSGVGSGGPIDSVLGGAFGVGLKSNVQRGLAFLTLNYQNKPGANDPDEIYLFGFSRGAYTARALAGVLGVAGIPVIISQSVKHWDFYRRLAKLEAENRGRNKTTPLYKRNAKEIKLLRDALADKNVTLYHPEDINIVCVGVFDTVGAYGVPMGLGLSGISNLFTYWTRGFHSRQVGAGVRVALHAMAIDEMRRPFSPTFWMEKLKRDSDEDEGKEEPAASSPAPVKAQVVEQMWFAGVHSNVGGGYEQAGLSDLPLAWMISRVKANTGLAFDDSELLAEIWPCPASTLYRSGSAAPIGRFRSILPRPADTLMARVWEGLNIALGRRRRSRRRMNEELHWSVKQRLDWENALVDKRGPQKYAPGNLKTKSNLKYSEPSDLELMLVGRGRDWMARCPMEAAGIPCRCIELEVLASKDGAAPRAAA